MTSEQIRRKARQLRAKTRRELLGNIGMPVAAAILCGLGVAQGHDPVQRTAFGLAIAWGLVGVYVLNRGMWPVTLPGDAAMTNGLEFYRRELDRRRYFLRRILQWSFGPIVLAIGAFIVPIVRKGQTSKVLPFTALVIIWMAATFVIRMREHRELQREIDNLNDIERENRS